MFAVIYIPNFHLQAVMRLEPELRGKRAAILDDTMRKATVFQLTEEAQKAGVEVGLTPTQAMARCRDVAIRSRSRAQEQAATETLLQCAYCFSPRIEATAEGVCTLDLKGLPQDDALQSHHRDDIEDWAATILRALGQVQLDARVGVAETPSLAWKAARLARPFLAVGDSDSFVRDLPLESLNPPRELLEVMEKWGVRSVGAFLALGKDKIAERLGPEAVEIFDLATSREVRPLKLVVPPETFEESMEFEQPVELIEPLLFGLRRFVESLTRRLDLIYLVAAELHLRLNLVSGEKYERALTVPAPTCDNDILFRMLHTHLENVRTDSPIQSIRLSAKPARSLNYQFGLFEVSLRDPNQFQETLARLNALLGPNRVGTPHVEDTHRPDSFHMDTERISRGIFGENEEESNAPQPLPIHAGGLALRRFRPPLSAVVEVRESRPAILRSTVFIGAISEAQGPWRISGDWWAERNWARDEWDVQTRDGGLFRLVRQDDQWFVEGMFD